jgi:hypothetical protein
MSLSKFQRYQGSLTQEVFSGELVDPDESSEEQVSSDPDFSRLTMIDSRVVGEERDVRVAAEEALDTRGSGMPKYHHPTLFMLRHLIEIFSAGEMSKVALKKKRIRRHAGLCGIVRRHGGITSAYHQGWNSVEVVASWEAFDGMHKVDERGIVYKAKEVRKGPNGLVAAYFPVAKDVFRTYLDGTIASLVKDTSTHMGVEMRADIQRELHTLKEDEKSQLEMVQEVNDLLESRFYCDGEIEEIVERVRLENMMYATMTCAYTDVGHLVDRYSKMIDEDIVYVASSIMANQYFPIRPDGHEQRRLLLTIASKIRIKAILASITMCYRPYSPITYHIEECMLTDGHPLPGNSLVEIGWVRCILSGRGRKMANKFRRMFILDSLESLVPQPNDMD